MTFNFYLLFISLSTDAVVRQLFLLLSARLADQGQPKTGFFSRTLLSLEVTRSYVGGELACYSSIHKFHIPYSTIIYIFLSVKALYMNARWLQLFSE